MLAALLLSFPALDALQVLLGAVMLRRSKTQTYLDGTPILELPTRSIVRAPVAVCVYGAHAAERTQ